MDARLHRHDHARSLDVVLNIDEFRVFGMVEAALVLAHHNHRDARIEACLMRRAKTAVWGDHAVNFPEAHAALPADARCLVQTFQKAVNEVLGNDLDSDPRVDHFLEPGQRIVHRAMGARFVQRLANEPGRERLHAPTGFTPPRANRSPAPRCRW